MSTVTSPSTSPLAWLPELFGVAALERDSAFSYSCHACNRCCHNYHIKVSPYEVLQLARYLGLSTTRFIDEQVVDDVFLRQRPGGACNFLGERGCTVHPARPLACRVYPLGVHVDAEGQERFSNLPPHPQTAGRYGHEGTVGSYLDDQGALPYMAANDGYLQVLMRLAAVLRQEGDEAEPPDIDLLDPDLMISRYQPLAEASQKADPRQAMHLHMAAIDEWITDRVLDRTQPKEAS